ncbi:PIG-L family deacetylase [bacterium]|nr:PIG-L family deacetylase [bacterium]
MKSMVVIAPHPDDETLGCGGTILKEKSAGSEVHWIVVTEISQKLKVTDEQKMKRAVEINEVAKAFDFNSFEILRFPAAELDTVPIYDLIDSLTTCVRRINPSDIYLPYPGDAHSDHKAVFDACIALTKWFRFSSVERVFAYETQSETDFDISPMLSGFRPNTFVDITDTIDKKIEIASIYDSEFLEHPFPRNFESMRALAKIRGSASGFKYAEAFTLLKQRIY